MLVDGLQEDADGWTWQNELTNEILRENKCRVFKIKEATREDQDVGDKGLSLIFYSSWGYDVIQLQKVVGYVKRIRLKNEAEEGPQLAPVFCSDLDVMTFRSAPAARATILYWFPRAAVTGATN